ncbi:hypothetical protein G9C98_005695 [Cotesia typhae]|uniref:CCD97-like C-terminal domain-containing protein n=1 Tax=Cotesia typhae TaxID=2053667 RepID=A0A8J5UUM3_9HYME|nr:hypothetical protein G9C98_005695 [Cotesia typhae]
MDQLLDQELMKPIVHVDNCNNDNNQQKNNDIEELSQIEDEIISVVAESTARFKCLHKNEPELTIDEKRTIARKLLHKSPEQFLARFGKFLNNDLLKYFETDDMNYGVGYYINKLRRYFNNASRELDTKNRRYEALKLLVEKGEYFSETAMMRRNPLLYENLVGQYLTEKQKKERDNADTDDKTFVDVLMQGIERDHIERLMKRQEDAENEVMEENDSDSEDDDEGCKLKKKPNIVKDNSQWGELPDGGKISCSKTKSENDFNEIETENSENKLKGKNIKTKEINILRQEFAYDNVELRTQDEEEKYFDSESPELINSPNVNQFQDESEDELDKYMNSLKEETKITQDPP